MKQRVYWNSKQLQFLQAKQPIRVFLGGRGIGKSSCIGGSAYMKAKALPRGRIFFSSTTYNQILTKTLPAILAKWDDFGLKEDIHYVVGKRPPKNWTQPLSRVKRYKNTIHFMNGFYIEFLSMDRPDLARGGSYDGAEIDEAALIPHDRFSRVLLPSVRGNLHKFDHWIHHNISLYTSVPWTSRGYWILEYEEKAEQDPEEYYFIEGTAYDNIEILGEKGIERLRREMTPLEFQVEVLNERFKKVETAFYHNYDDDKHTYQPRYAYDDEAEGLGKSRGMDDVISDQLLECSFDFSGWFNCCTVWQGNEQEERCKRYFWVKDQEKLNQLVDKICDHFDGHQMKYARLWGEPRGHDKRADGETLYEQIAGRFRMNGWDAVVRAQAGRTKNHLERNHLINEVLEGGHAHLPKILINQDGCKDMLIALKITEITPDGKKNKKKEKDRSFPQEHAPHVTDTLDYYIVQKYGDKVGMEVSGRGGFVAFG